LFCVRPEFRKGLEILRQDVRDEFPPGRFHVILCRHVVFTYFEETLQTEILDRMVARLEPGGILVAGKQEPLPGDYSGLSPLGPKIGVYQRIMG
jgi:chemotaxis protein methyltransferase CheR